MDFQVDSETRKLVEATRELGEKEFRPAGLEADRNGAPIRWATRSSTAASRGVKGAPAGPAPTANAVEVRSGPWSPPCCSPEELAYWDRGVINATPGPGLPESNVLSMGTDEQKERFLGPFLEPDVPRWACFGMTEPGAGSDAAALKTQARKDGDGWILNGAKCFIGAASRSDWILVQATLDPSKGRAAQRAFFVEHGTPGLEGFKIEKKMASRPTSPRPSRSTTAGCQPRTCWAARSATRARPASRRPCAPSMPDAR